VSFTFTIPAVWELGPHMVTVTADISGSVSTTFDMLVEVKTGGSLIASRSGLMGLSLGLVAVAMGVGMLVFYRRV